MKLCTAGLVISILVIFFCADNAISKPVLTIDLGPPVYYTSDNGDIFVARYGSLSDKSLSFVKVVMPDGQEYTLPSVISGSGVRYTDERQLVWWSHQGRVRIDIRDARGNWKKGYLELRKVHRKK
ncbi:MAG: lysozyme inhibitor [Desulfobacteraceae bacterium]|nr:lysozyme inhibitor [Desulfobacteraceae bacterium]